MDRAFAAGVLLLGTVLDNLKSPTLQTKEQCEVVCNAEASCVGFVVTVGDSCTFFSSITDGQRSPGSTAYMKYAEDINKLRKYLGSFYAQLKGKKFEGEGGVSHAGTFTKEQCGRKCAMERCAGFEITAEGRCMTYSRVISKVADNTIGIKYFVSEEEPPIEANNQLANEGDDRRTTEADDRLTTEADHRLTTEADDRLSTEADDRLTTEADDRLTTEADDRLTTEADDRLTSEADDPLTTAEDGRFTTEASDPLTTEAPYTFVIIANSLNPLYNVLGFDGGCGMIYGGQYYTIGACSMASRGKSSCEGGHTKYFYNPTTKRNTDESLMANESLAVFWFVREFGCSNFCACSGADTCYEPDAESKIALNSYCNSDGSGCSVLLTVSFSDCDENTGLLVKVPGSDDTLIPCSNYWNDEYNEYSSGIGKTYFPITSIGCHGCEELRSINC